MDNPYLAIGSVFAGVLVLILTAAYFVDRKESQTRWNILRVFSSVCAGASGAFLSGGAVFRLSANPNPLVSLVVAGTAGVALFLMVWATFGRFKPTAETHPDGVAFSIGLGWSFEQTAAALAGSDGARVEFVGFSKEELAAKMSPQRLEVPNISTALEILGSLVLDRAIRPYSVALQRPIYTLQAR